MVRFVCLFPWGFFILFEKKKAKVKLIIIFDTCAIVVVYL